MSDDEGLVYIHWDKDELGYRWPSLRARNTGELLEPFTPYLEALVLEKRKLRSGTKGVASLVEPATYALASLASFLIRTNRKLYRITGDWLDDIREEMFDAIKANPISRGKANAMKRTANAKLRYIYKFLYWCQQNRKLPTGTIGWNMCRVRSSLPEADTRGAKVDRQAKRLYPKCYERVGGSTRQDEGQYWATAEDFDKIEDHFWATHEHLIAVRNTLAMRIQKLVGWRNESVNSLTIYQFSEKELGVKRSKPFC
jgi:hypothetical protein